MNHTNSQLVHQIMKEVMDLVPGIDQRQLFARISGTVSLYEVKELENFSYHPDIEDKIELYLAAKKLEGLSPKTIKDYRLKLGTFAKHINKLVGDISTNDIRMYLGLYHDKNMASTIDSKLSTLKSFFSWLQEEEMIVKDPAKKIKPVKGNSRLRTALTVEELELMREACESLRERALVEFLYATGCRLDEVHKLDKDDVNWNSLTATVIGKGDKERRVYVSPKTKIHMNKYFLNRKDNEDCLFCTERRPFKRLGHRAIQEIIQAVGERAGIKKRVHPHLLRHTLATFMVNNGADLITIQKILGHEQLGTTQIYTKLSDENIQNEYRKHLIV